MRNGIILAGIAFGITSAVFVVNRLSSEALAVVIGTICGIAASIPISISVFIAASRNRGHRERDLELLNTYPSSEYPYGYTPGMSRGHGAQPPVVVISPSPPSPYTLPQSQYYLPPNVPTPGMPRDFRIVGEE